MFPGQSLLPRPEPTWGEWGAKLQSEDGYVYKIQKQSLEMIWLDDKIVRT